MPEVNGTDIDTNNEQPAATKGGKKTLEKTYQKKTQLEHILLRPDTYIGSVEHTKELMWVYDAEEEKISQKEISFVPGLYKIFDEILVNAADNKQRDSKMDTIKVDIDAENNTISVYNNGKGIPVAMHKDEKMYVPTMIFGHLLTSSNYNDEEQKVTGGRNGFGAKLCNIFSTKFTVETSSKEYKKSFKQVWANNMGKTSDAKIKDSNAEDFTKVTFSPDLAKFRMESLDADMVALMSRRAYDIAASSKGVKVFLNGKKLPIKGFKEYVDLYLKGKMDDSDNQIKAVYEQCGERWEVAVALSDKGFQQMSFVNSIATTKGGRHVEYVTDALVRNLIDTLKKKNKSGVSIKPFQIKNHMWVFVNCLIVNPTFDSQTKENMTLQVKSFGSKCTFSDKYISSVVKCGIVEAVMAWAKFKQMAQLNSKCLSKRHTKLKGIPKLEDANDAGTKNSSECTLILTEGDSAKTLAVAGLGVVGRDRYGVFPLRGKLLNVREATHKQILENAEINNLIKILGLQYKKKYESQDDVKTLRYGKLMIMTDQDQDGSHIKGLLINFIHHNWPTLLQRNFMEEFITPIVKASKGKEELSFYSLPEFEEWKHNKDNWHTYKIKYYKGLGTSTSKEAKEYFQDMKRHRIKFKYGGNQDDHAIMMAFSKKAIEQRKEWLTSHMEECKRRKELGLPDIYLYEKDTQCINYTDFVNKELVLFSNMDNERSIPCLVDGFKPGQRKVMFTCMKRNDKREVKVAQLAGSVAEHSAYHHGETSLMMTIIGLAQNYVGSNNINLLQPIGQFGTRLQGGKDAASPRYIFTQLSTLTRLIFHPHDDALLKPNYDDNQRIEPEWYIPIIPMVLVNGAEGIGTGWSTRVPNYNPREIVKNLKKMMDGEEPSDMLPWYKNFTGTIENFDATRYLISGVISRLSNIKFEITELPIRKWTQDYKENVMEGLMTGTEKSSPIVSDYKEYNTDTTVRFVVSIPDDKVNKVNSEGHHKVFKLQNCMSIASMVLFDHLGALKRYSSVKDILKDFYELRLSMYVKRKDYLVGMLEAEAGKLTNQARFILEKCDGRLVIENKKKKLMIEELLHKGYDSDPVKAWKKIQDKLIASSDDSDHEDNEAEEVDSDGPDYDYLLGMAMWCLTQEKIDELLKKRDDKLTELENLKRKSPINLWNDDLDAFLLELDKVEKKQFEDDNQIKKGKGKEATKKNSKQEEDTKPSPFAECIIPQMDFDMKKKIGKAAAAKKIKSEGVMEDDEFDDIVSSNTGKSLSSRLGNSPDKILKKAKAVKRERKGDGLKQTKLGFKSASPKKKKSKDEWDSESESVDVPDASSDMDTESPPVAPRERAVGRRAAASKAKYSFSDDEGEASDHSNISLHSNKGIDEPEMKQGHISIQDNSIFENAKENVKMESSDSDSEFESNVQESKLKSKPKPKLKPSADPVPKKDLSASEMFDSLLQPEDMAIQPAPNPKPDPKPKKVSAPKKRTKVLNSNEDEPIKKKIASKKTYGSLNGSDMSDDDQPQPKKAAPKKTAAPKPKKKNSSDSESNDMFDEKPAKKGKAKATKLNDSFDSDMSNITPREMPGRAKKPRTYVIDDNESDSDY